MEATPSNVNYDAVEAAIKKVEGVEDVHDLHIWCLTNGKNSLSAHITAHDPFRTLKKVEHELKHHQKMAHITIQIENPNDVYEHKSTLHKPLDHHIHKDVQYSNPLPKIMHAINDALTE